jgi:hypothetical protein
MRSGTAVAVGEVFLVGLVGVFDLGEVVKACRVSLGWSESTEPVSSRSIRVL